MNGTRKVQGEPCWKQYFISVATIQLLCVDPKIGSNRQCLLVSGVVLNVYNKAAEATFMSEVEVMRAELIENEVVVEGEYASVEAMQEWGFTEHSVSK